MSNQSQKQNFKRTNLNIPEDLDRVVLDLRMTEKYCRCSYADIVRALMWAGAKTLHPRYRDSGAKS